MSLRSKELSHADFDAISVSVASPDQIYSWSHGEITKPETINYRTQKPERDGLFCERIFGPTKNWECYCGKYKKIRYKNIVCDKCGVEVTRSSVRRERMGHIKLAVPVVHIWFLRSTPSRVGLLLDMSVKNLERVVYFANYLITEIDEDTRTEAIEELEKDFLIFKNRTKDEHKKERNELELQKKKGEKITDKMFSKLDAEFEKKIDDIREQFDETKDSLEGITKYQTLSELQYRDYSMKFGHCFKAGMGAEAIWKVIHELDLQGLINNLKKELKETVGQKRKKIIQRIMLAGSLIKANIKPEWMIMTVLPVIPPDLRPMVQLDGGRFATSDLNDLYRRVINRNNRLKRLLSMGAPEVICRNEKRMLQEAVDALLHNSARQGKAITKTGSRNLSLKSLSDILKGKQGRFRQNLLGKRVDYSGRSVIVVGPNLKLDECGLPKKMALELFKPFVLGDLIRNGNAHNIKHAEKLILWNKPEIWDSLEKVTQHYYVLLNRAPTLHRLGIQGFRPVLVEGKALQLHPLVCTAFNADFDGDQMAVHVPLSKMAQWETKHIISSAVNLLKPSSGSPIITPSLDIVLGCYYITKHDVRIKEYPHVFANEEEVLLAESMEAISLRQAIKVRINNEIITTTPGRIIFNEIVPEEAGFLNDYMTAKKLSSLIADMYEATNIETTAKLADDIKNLGFKYITISGISLSSSDMVIPKEKKSLIADADLNVDNINKQYRYGLITDDERYNHVLKVWGECKSKLQDLMMENLDEHGHVFQMIDSGARGNIGQLVQMAGMKGLVTNPAGRIIELPVKANFKEGAKMIEYFIAQHGGRKGRSDTALKTASAGYLTRRLVDAVQDVLISEEDCGSNHVEIITNADSEEIGIDFEYRIYGRTLGEDLVFDDKTVFKKGSVIDRSGSKKIIRNKITEVPIQSIIGCEAKEGICQKCYGRDLSSNKLVALGTSVGIIAAQSIGEPGTQLTMRTFHMGGVAAGKDITQGLPRVEELFEARKPKFPGIISEISGQVTIERNKNTSIIHVQSDEVEKDEFQLIENFEPIVKVGDKVKVKEIIAKRTEGKGSIKAKSEGRVTSITKRKIIIEHLSPAYREHKITAQDLILVEDKSMVIPGQPITEGHLDLHAISAATEPYNAQHYIVREVQSIYAAQGQIISDKHIEVISRQMFSKCRIIETSDSEYLPGQIAEYLTVKEISDKLEKEGKKPIIFDRLLLGLTRLSLSTDSWLSAASFQETIRVLVEASITRKIDGMKGLKENVIIGKLIPAGTNFNRDLRSEIYGKEFA